MKSLFLIGLIATGSPVSARTLAETYYISATMPEGKYQGRPLNTNVKRPAVILNGSRLQKELNVDDRHWLIANIYHNKKFYIGVVPKAAVSQVLFLTEPFMGVLAHSMLRFQFSQPIKLVAEVPTQREIASGFTHKPLEEPLELNDLLMSVEATAPHGVNEFSTTESFLNTRGLVYRVMSLTGLGISRLQSGKAKIYQHPLNLTEREAARVLRNALYTSDNAGMSKMYNTLFANCNKYCAGILEQSRKLAEREITILGKLMVTLQSMAANFMVFAKFNPPAFRLLAAKEAVNMEHDPEFIRLAADYPAIAACELSLKTDFF